MDKIKELKCELEELACVQLACLEEVDTHEMGEVIDMIKDLAEAMYYCSIVHAMEESDSNK